MEAKDNASFGVKFAKILIGFYIIKLIESRICVLENGSHLCCLSGQQLLKMELSDIYLLQLCLSVDLQIIPAF